MASPKRIGHYQVERLLGTGSFATVFLVYDPGLDGRVALKILAENWSLDDDVKRRFLEEARILWRAQHDRIVRVHLVEEEDGRPYFVMDYADGGTLHERIRDRYGRGEPFTVGEAVAMAREIAECLTVAHDLGIVHRDLKPSNILFQSLPGRRSSGEAPGERVLLADFGLARRLEAAVQQTVVAGTPAYMAPEQGDTATASSANERADVFSANAILYELLAGQPPFPGQSIDSVRDAQRYEKLKPLPGLRDDVPAALDAAIRRGLAFDPADRFASALEWADALTAALLDPEPATLPTPVIEGPSTRVARAARRLRASAEGSPITGALGQAEDELGGPAHLAVVGTSETAVAELAARLAARDGLVVEQVLALAGGDAPQIPPLTSDGVLLVLPQDPTAVGPLIDALRTAAAAAEAGPVVAVGLLPQPEGAADHAGPLRVDPAIQGTLLTVLGFAVPLADEPEGRGLLDADEVLFGSRGGGWLPPLTVREIGALVDRLVVVRRDELRADSAVALLRRALVTHAHDAAVGDLADAIERLDLANPELAELASLRADLAGTLPLSAEARTEMRRLLLAGDPATRLGLEPDAHPADRSAAALEAAERWRAVADRLPYASRGLADPVVRRIGQLWQQADQESRAG